MVRYETEVPSHVPPEECRQLCFSDIDHMDAPRTNQEKARLVHTLLSYNSLRLLSGRILPQQVFAKGRKMP